MLIVLCLYLMFVMCPWVSCDMHAYKKNYKIHYIILLKWRDQLFSVRVLLYMLCFSILKSLSILQPAHFGSRFTHHLTFKSQFLPNRCTDLWWVTRIYNGGWRWWCQIHWSFTYHRQCESRNKTENIWYRDKWLRQFYHK